MINNKLVNEFMSVDMKNLILCNIQHSTMIYL